MQLLAAPWVFMGVELAKAERCAEFAAWLEAEPSPMRVKPPVTSSVWVKKSQIWLQRFDKLPFALRRNNPIFHQIFRIHLGPLRVFLGLALRASVSQTSFFLRVLPQPYFFS
jgi:hypothetical protein